MIEFDDLSATMEALAAIIRKWIEESESSRPEWAAHRLEFIQGLWPAVVGRALARRTKPVGWRNERLRIAVADPAWRGQMEALAAALLATVQRWFPPHLVTGLEFTVEEHLFSPISPPQAVREVEAALSGTDAAADLDSALQAIQDDELRKLVREVASRFFSRTSV